MNKNIEKVKCLLQRAEKLKVNLQNLSSIEKCLEFRTTCKRIYLVLSICLISVFFICNRKLLNNDDCVVSMPTSLSHSFRKPENCDFCRDVLNIPRLENLSPMDFEKQFAYTGKPVIVTDATANWTALNVFNFWYFKSIYENSQKNDELLNCQFFPYKTDFKNLYEALSIPKDRVNYEAGTKPWYFGWSNCNYEVAQLLREHYGRPYFLPETSENNAIDWIFMGGSGLGAHMHVDNVRLPSWQAQIKGTKEWTLAPPPECYYSCRFHKVTVKIGDISEFFLLNAANVLLK